MMYKYVKWSEKEIISKQTNFFLLFHFTFLRVLDNTCSTLRKYLYNFFFGGGGVTLGARIIIIIIDANSYKFQIVETSELSWGSNRACLGSTGSLKRSPKPPIHFLASPHAESRLGTCHDNDMFSGVMPFTLYLHPQNTI